MSKIKLSFTALLTLVMLGMFAALASAEGFTPTPSNPAPGINVGTVDNYGNSNAHKTHGDFQNNTNSCANCHSAHNGGNEKLVIFQNTESNMCLTCHDGTMGFYNVLEASGAGTFNKTHESASSHPVGVVKIGSAPLSYQQNSTATLECSSCHNPHGSVNDRLLKEAVLGSTLFAPDVPKGTKAVTLDLKEDPAYEAINSSSTNSGLKITKSTGPLTTSSVNYSKFCSSCHNDAMVKSGTKRADGHYSHTTNSSSGGRNCASCHYAHGTDITLLKDTQGKTIADYMKPLNQGGAEWSREKAVAYMQDVSAKGSNLKKYTNMAVCWSCHITSHPIDTQKPGSEFLLPNGQFPGKPAK